jgi:hypothetical protein
MIRMLATEYLPDSPVTTTVPIAIPAHIDSLTASQIPGVHAQFVADNTSVKRIEKVMTRGLGPDGCAFQVYYFKRTPFRFLVTVTLKFAQITGSDFIPMFAEKEPEIVITPLAEKVISTDLQKINPQQRERLQLVKSYGEDRDVDKVIYIDRGESERIAS